MSLPARTTAPAWDERAHTSSIHARRLCDINSVVPHHKQSTATQLLIVYLSLGGCTAHRRSTVDSYQNEILFDMYNVGVTRTSVRLRNVYKTSGGCG
jgi:hypothetical protein